ncbi:MAG: hypothetical protein K8R90_00515 [Candidatus Cloacimonetes bacterium]|nr:hypothetical protein [Candidatus Cloacimonadota bacterium]
MRQAGRVVMLALGLWLLLQTALVPVFNVPHAAELRLRSQREGVPAKLPVMQSALLLLDLDRRSHDHWQVFATLALSGLALLSLLTCGAMSFGAAVQWLRFPFDPYAHARHFGLTISGAGVVAFLLLTQLMAYSAAADFRYLSLSVWGWIALAAGGINLVIHHKLERNE